MVSTDRQVGLKVQDGFIHLSAPLVGMGGRLGSFGVIEYLRASFSA